MRAGKYIHLRLLEGPIQPCPIVCSIEFDRIKPPAGQGLGVPVHDPDATVANAVTGHHGQHRQRSQDRGKALCGRFQPRMNTIGARHGRRVYRVRIGAAATGVVTCRRQFRFDIACHRMVF